MPPTQTIVAKGDSAASKNYWREEDIKILSNVQPYSGQSVILPDGDLLAPSQKGLLPLSNEFSNEAKEATVLKALKSSSLVSLGQICDDNCTIILDKEKLVALKSPNVQTE